MEHHPNQVAMYELKEGVSLLHYSSVVIQSGRLEFFRYS